MSKEKLKCKRCKHKISIEKYRSLDYPYCRSCERVLNGGNLPKIQGKINPAFKAREERIKQSKPKVITSIAGIYSVYCKITKKTYIGQSSNLKRRIDNYKNNTGYINFSLKNDLLKYGLSNFTFEVKEELPNSTEEIRLEREAYYKGLYSLEELYNVLPGIETKEAYSQWKEQQNSDTQ